MATDYTSQFQSLISDLTKPITLPTPRGSKAASLSKGSFELNPFAETVYVDPYAPKDMAGLTEAELSIDNVISYLDSILPSDLLSTLMNLPELANELLNRAETLEQFIINIKDKFTFNLNFQDALRQLGILNIYENIDSFKSRCLAVGDRFEDMNDRFFQKGMSTMSKARSKYGRYSYSNDWDIADSSNYKYADSGIAVAKTDKLTSTYKTIGTTLKENGGINNKDLTKLSINTDPKDLPIVLGGIKALGTNNATSVINDINNNSKEKTINKITDIGVKLANTSIDPDTPIDKKQIANVKAVDDLSLDNSTQLKDIQNTASISDEKIKNISQFTTSIGEAGTTYIKNSLTTTGIVTIRDTYLATINKTVSKYSITKLQNIIDYIDANSLALWLTNNDRVPVDDFITLIETGDYILTKYIVKSLSLIGTGKITQSLTLLDETDELDIAKITDLNTNVETFHSSVSNILEMTQEDFNTINNLATTYGTADLVLYTDLINSILLDNLLTLVGSLANVNHDEVIKVIPVIENIKGEDITNINSKIISSNPNAIITSYSNLTNPFLNFVIHETCLNYAKIGDYITIRNLLNTYPNSMSYSERQQLSFTILENYKISDNDIILGYTTAASIFLNALLLINPDLLITKRNGEEIKTVSPWVKASKDALHILKYNPVCEIGITLQINKNFRG